MKVISTRFGTVEVKENEILTFPEGLVGFAACKRFFIYNKEKNYPFFWLQSIDDPKLAFVIADPALFFPDYKISTRKQELAVIDTKDTKDLIICVIISISRDPFRMSANLQGPLVINTGSHKGKQLVLVDTSYSTRHTIPIRKEALKEVPAGLFIPRNKQVEAGVNTSLVLT